MSSFDNIIPPEISGDEFYFLIREIARRERLHTVLEIGSSAGGGSTQAFVEGLSENISKPQLFCMELSRPRFEALQERYRQFPFVKCYNVSSVPVTSLMTDEQVSDFYRTTPTNLNQYPLDQILGWRKDDIRYIESSGVPQNGIKLIKEQNGIKNFDMVLIDGSAFTGEAELDEVYGARIILLDDIQDIKCFRCVERLKRDPHYQLVAENRTLRNGFALFARIKEIEVAPGAELPINFFTIVLNGNPFIQHHIEMMKNLPFRWHWHIVEGVANLTHCTSWGAQNGGGITGEIHRDGLSNDGTSAYLDSLKEKYPNQITIYRKPPGVFWDGKIEMVNAPLKNIKEECILWEIDADELWTTEQVVTARESYLHHPDKTAGFYFCHYFVGENLVVSTRNTYGNHTEYEWVRTWRFKVGDEWQSHEPPRLCRKLPTGQWYDLASVKPFTHNETERLGLVFQHFAYVMPAQVRFKEVYYGYKDAVPHWMALQKVSSSPIMLRNYLPWVKDETEVRRAEEMRIKPIATRTSNGSWQFDRSWTASPAGQAQRL